MNQFLVRQRLANEQCSGRGEGRSDEEKGCEDRRGLKALWRLLIKYRLGVDFQLLNSTRMKGGGYLVGNF